MCGRFTQTSNITELLEEFQFEWSQSVQHQSSYNIAPSQSVLAMVQAKDHRKAGLIQWGLVPHWVKQRQEWKPLINARAETIHEKASFKTLIERRRCVIFANGFFEWKRNEGQKIPFYFSLKTNQPFGFAALWDRHGIGNEEIITCTIITTEANELVQPVHDRMPVILVGDDLDTWINVNQNQFLVAQNTLKPFSASEMQKIQVSTLVNSTKNNGPECISPIVV